MSLDLFTHRLKAAVLALVALNLATWELWLALQIRDLVRCK